MDLPHPACLPIDVDAAIAAVFTRPAATLTPAQRALVSDPAWQARHDAWLATPKGLEHTAWHARPWSEISAEIGAEHRAEMEGRHPGATRGRGVIPDFYED